MRILSFVLLFVAFMAKGQSNIIKVEYWIDTDPGFDLATQAAGLVSQPELSLQIDFPANINEGFHIIGVRSKDTNNIWSQTNLFPIYVADSSSGFISTVEYFWNRDNGIGNTGTDTTFASTVDDLSNGILNIPINLPLNSFDTLYVRSKDTRGRWSQTNYIDSTFYVAGIVSVADLATEYGVSIYPNPFKDAISISPQNNITAKIVICDSGGKILYNKVINQDTKINTQALSSGVYTVFVWIENRKMYRASIIKQ